MEFSKSLMSFIAILLLLSYFIGNFFLPQTAGSGGLDINNLTGLANWIRGNTSQNATYLFISDNTTYSDEDIYSENMPYFIQRTPMIEPWGAEWSGLYN